MDYWGAVAWALAPTIVVSALFFFILRSALRADRTERRAYARIEAQERAKRGMPAKGDAAASGGRAPRTPTSSGGRAPRTPTSSDR